MKKILILFFTIAAAGLLTAQQADRSAYPEVGKPGALELPEIQSFVLDNGLPVFLVEKHDLPIVQFNLVFNAGSIFDPPGKEGLAAMTAELMDEGAGARNALELAEEIDFLGISLNSFAGREQLGVRLFSPVSRLDEAMPLFADIVLRPRFEADELERKRTEYLVDLAQAHDEPQAIARAAFRQLVFGENHPYGRPADGAEKSLNSLTTDELKDFHREFITPANAFLVVVGDITEGEAERQLRKYFRSWTGGKRKMLSTPEPPSIKGFRTYLIDKPGAAQSVLYFGHPGVSRTNEDEYPITLMNTILGASFTSRLNQNIREEHGYSYGAGSSFYQPRGKGYFIAASSVQTDVTAPAIAEFRKELAAIDEVTAEEAEKARNYQAFGFPSELERIESIAGNVSDVIFYSLPMDYLNRHVSKLLAVMETDIERAARIYIDPGNMILVIVGDRSAIAEGVEALNLGEIKYMSIEDVLGPVPEIERNN